ncbi:hypothetical protein UFOVP156_27 [uncultured Caudovirales phage]|uniref:Large polyvalent protein-associated domain-containing protein n=1 Tax=uncultured Caudovirales phage TaxID=2100421 RepID=A0A6J7W9M3_9CAUD|nr:hypothetical protein UFOVP156_27 [uncultured Caudovirales phage]
MAISFADLLPVPTDAQEPTRAERRRSSGINFDDLVPKADAPAASAISFDDLTNAAAPPQGVVSSPAAAATSESAGGEAALSAPSEPPIVDNRSWQERFVAQTGLDPAAIGVEDQAQGEKYLAQDQALRGDFNRPPSVASAFEPSVIQRLGQFFGLTGNRDRASNELFARELAAKEGVSVDSVYKRFGGAAARPTLNPEGRPALTALTEGAAVAAESATPAKIGAAAANTIARAIRGGDIKAEDDGFLDWVITQTKSPDAKIDKNYQSLGNIGESLGYSLVTLVSSAAATAGTGLVTANPVAGVAAGFGAGATTSYRASVDDFLSRVKTNLDKQSNKLYGRPLDEEQWSAAKNQYMGAAREYGAWEAIPESVSNLVFLKAFAAPMRGMKVDALTSVTQKAGSLLAEQATETMTGFGQNKPELEAGLTQDQKSIRDAFKDQFLQTLLVTGLMAGGAKGVSAANEFYKSRIEPTIAPDTALGRALLADLQEMGFSPESAQREAVARLSPDNAQMTARPISFDDLVPPAGVASPPPPPPPDDQGGGTAAAITPVDPNAPAVDPNAPVVDPNAPAADPNAVVAPPAPAPYEQLSVEEKTKQLDLAKSVYEGMEIVLPIEYSWGKLSDSEREKFSQQFYQFINSGLTESEMLNGVRGLLSTFRSEVDAGRANPPAPTTGAEPTAPQTQPSAVDIYFGLGRIDENGTVKTEDQNWYLNNGMATATGENGRLQLTPLGRELLARLDPNANNEDMDGEVAAAVAKNASAANAPAAAPTTPDPAATTTTATTTTTADPNAPPASAAMTREEFLKSYVALQDIANGFNLRFKDLSDETKAMLSGFVLRGNAGKLTLTPAGADLLKQLNQIKGTDEALNVFNAALGNQQQTTPAATTTPAEPTTPAATTTTTPVEPTAPTTTTTDPQPGQAPQLTDEQIDQIYIGLQRSGEGLYMAQKQAVKSWLMENNMVEVVDNAPVLSARGRDLLEKFDDIQGDFTLQARELINSLGTPTATTIVAAVPTATKTVAAEPTATTTQSTADANDPAVVEQLKRFEGGVFKLSYSTGAGGAANRKIAQQTDEQATKTYDAAAAIFLSRAFTAPVPAKNQDTLNVENIYNVTVTPVEKKIAAAKNDTSYRNALFKIAGNMDVRYYLNGILIEPNTKIVAVTDGHRMAIVQDMDATNWYQTPESMDAYPSIVVGRDGNLIRDGKFPDWRRVQPNSAPESAFVSFDANAVASQLRGVVQGYKYITGKGNKSTTTPQSIKINGVTGSFQAPYMLDAAEFFLRMGYTSFNAQFGDQDPSRLFLVSPDKRVQQVIMGLRDVRGEPVFTALTSDTPANFSYDKDYSIITASKSASSTAAAGTPVVKPKKPRKPRTPKPEALAAFDTISAILEDAGITDPKVATAVSTEYDRLTGLEEDDNGAGLDTGSLFDGLADGQPSNGVSGGGNNNEAAPATDNGQQDRQQRGGRGNGQDLLPSAERENRQAQGGEPQNEPATTQAGTLDDQTLDELTLEGTDGAATNNQDRPAGGSTQGGTGMGGRGQTDGQRDLTSGGEGSNYPNTRGTRVGAFVTTVSFTNRASFFRDAFAQAGIDPAVANNLPIERQYRILADLMVSQFGVRFVDNTPRASLRKSVDELLDLHRNLQFMVAALELPMQSIGLDKTLGIVNMEKQQYFAVYYPQGLVLQARGTKELPNGKIMSGAFVGLPNRTNSFAHEWGHALDFYLQAEFARTHGGNGLSYFIRESGIAPQVARASEAAYVNLINTLFFDQALTAAKIMELERKIATSQSASVQATAQRQLDEIRAGNSKLRSTKGEYYKRVKQLGNDDYFLQPTEMIARSFETYISTIVENLGGSTEALTKSLSAYNNQAVDYMQNAYPQQADRDAINAAWSAVFDALRAESVLNKTGAPAATKPVDANIIDPFEMLRLTPDSRSIIQREVDAWKDLKAEASRNDQRAPNPKGAVLLYEDAMRSFLWSERGGLLTMIARYPNSPTIKNIVSRLTTDPGTSNLNNRLTFEESRSKTINQFGSRFGEILKRYNLDKLDANGTEVLRRMLVSQPDQGLPALAAMAKYPQLTEAADKIRNLFNDLWYYGDNAGLKMGYAPNGYLPRMYDMTKIVTDPDGFREAAERVYNEMFDTKFEDFRSDDAIARSLLARALQILRIKPKRLPMHATGFSQTEADDIKDAVKAYKAALASMQAAPNAQDPDAALAAAEQEMEAALDLIDGVYDAIKTVDGNLRAATWLQEAWVGSAEANNSYSPDAEFLKGRVLPPSADVLMREYLNTDVVSLINDYIPKIVNKAEYERRFGRMDMADAKRKLYEQGVLPDDVAYIFQTIEKLTGRSHDNTLGATAKVVSKIQAYGIMAMLGRAVMSAAAEPLGAAIQTRDVRQGFRAMFVTLSQFLPTASARDRQTIAEVIGLVGNPYMDQALANREGGQFLNDPNLNQRMAKYFIFTLQHGWLKNTTVGALNVAQSFLRNRISTNLDPSLKPAERDRAMRDLQEMGLQPSDVAQFFEWMQYEDSNGESLLSGKKLSIDELQSDMGQLYSDMLYRMTRKIILDPQPTDTSSFSKTTLGRSIMSIQSFAYTFQRQYLAAAGKKIQEEYKKTGSIGQTSRVAAGIASGFAALYVGHTLISVLRELVFNPARLAEKDKEDELLSYLLKLGFSRAGLAGAFDPLFNAVEGLKYEKDVANTLIGAVPSYFAQALQKMLMPFARNSEKTNTAEYNAITGFYDLALVPLMARGMTSLPAGPISVPLVALAYGYATSPAAKKAVAEFFVGEKPQPKRRKAGSSTYGF